MKNKKLFESWVICQFGENIKIKLEPFHSEDGYLDETINAMWIGFNAGIELAD